MTPDKWIRKYLVSALQGLVVNGKSIPVSDMRIPDNSTNYILLTTIDKSNPQESKCNRVWNVAINIDIVTVYQGNSGSRVFAEDIQDAVLSRIANPVIENFTVQSFEVEFSPDLSSVTSTQSIFRKIIIYNLKLKENGITTR